MTIERDFAQFHKSISYELNAVQDRVRNLIGSSRWQDDGEHKESVLRRILKSFLPSTVSVGSGFVCFERDNSTQIDILITESNAPSLYRDNDFTIVTSDVVRAIIEVKTSISGPAELKEVLNVVADNAEKLRKESNIYFKSGLFVFEDMETSQETVLKALKEVNGTHLDHRAINFLAIGNNRFFRFWEVGSSFALNEALGAQWRAYNLLNLSQAYFISNIVSEICQVPQRSERFWFPAEGGKERHCTHHLHSVQAGVLCGADSSICLGPHPASTASRSRT